MTSEQWMLDIKKEVYKEARKLAKLMTELNEVIPTDNPQLLLAYIDMYSKLQLQIKQEMMALKHKDAHGKNMKRIANLRPQPKPPVQVEKN